MFARVLLIPVLVVLSSCGDECSSYSKFSCSQIQAATYNVMFSDPGSDNSRNIGQVQGLDSCGNSARQHAENLNISKAKWSYVCCMVANGSSCAEKHR